LCLRDQGKITEDAEFFEDTEKGITSASSKNSASSENNGTVVQAQTPDQRYQGFPALSPQRRINVLDGNDLSSTFFAVSIPAEGTSFGSSKPICTSTEA
jgi:hypothetical protein